MKEIKYQLPLRLGTQYGPHISVYIHLKSVDLRLEGSVLMFWENLVKSQTVHQRFFISGVKCKSR